MCDKNRDQTFSNYRETVCQEAWALETGAGTVIAVALITSISLMLTLLLSVTNRWVQQGRLDALAENAAIAGADSLRGLTTGAPCDVARQVVLSGSANIISCSIIETDLLIQLEQSGLTAKSRAGETIH